MDKALLIVGHGIAGCTLAMTCLRKGIPFKMVGCSLPGEASPASSGLIAPITGRRYVKAWMIDELVAKALDFYKWSEGLLGSAFFFPVEIVRYLSHPEAKIAWEKRLYDQAYSNYISRKTYPVLDGLNRPYGILTGGYRLDTPGWIDAVRSFLHSKGTFEVLDKPFRPEHDPERIKVFATGAVDNSFAPRVIPNKGEALLVRMTEWIIPSVIKEEVFIVPLPQQSMYWIGSYYEPFPDNISKTAEGKRRLLESIRKVYSGPLEVIEHYAGVRPTVNDRRPLIGVMPGQTDQYMFNGMGTKGTSLAPYWAEQLIAHITEGVPLPEEVSPNRYIPEPVYKT